MEEQQTELQEQVEVTPNNPFSDESWSETPVEHDATTLQEPNKESDKKETKDEEEIIDANDYLKRELGFDDWNSAKQEIEQLRKIKDSPKDFDFANENSRKAFDYLKEGKEDDLFQYLNEKKRVEKLTTAEVNESNAAEIIKFGMQQKYKDLTPEQIDYRFNKKFALPSEPKQTYDETDEDFEVRQEEWKSKVEDAKMDLLIEAKLTKPELEKYKAELVLPDIPQKFAEETPPTPEELEQMNKYYENFKASTESSINSFEGFKIEYKDEDVVIPITYVPSDEERKSVTEKMKAFADDGYNANVLFAQRWLNNDGSINTNQVARDLYLLENDGKIAQKFVNDGVAKRLVEYRKKVSNISVSGTKSEGTFRPEGEKTETQKMADFFWDN